MSFNANRASHLTGLRPTPTNGPALCSREFFPKQLRAVSAGNVIDSKPAEDSNSYASVVVSIPRFLVLPE